MLPNRFSDVMLNYISCVFKSRFPAALALVMSSPFLLLLSLWFTELKLWFWSSWRQFVSSEEATKSFSLRSTTLKRYDLRWKGEPVGVRGPVCPYIPNCGFRQRLSPLGKCCSSRFLGSSKGPHPLVDRLEAPVQRCNAGQPAQPSEKTVPYVLRRFVRLIKAAKSKEADVKDSLGRPSPVWMRHSGC